MARRRIIELPPGARPFERPASVWRDLGAPEWVIDAGAATEKYVLWAQYGYGRGADPSDETIRKYFVEMTWLTRCVRPRYLIHAGALNSAEHELLSNGQLSRWGSPGRCWAELLEADAVGVPRWLWCCRRDPRTVTR
jgi:hypothetical protein